MKNLAYVFLGVCFGVIPGMYFGIKIAIKEYKFNTDWWKEYSNK